MKQSTLAQHWSLLMLVVIGLSLLSVVQAADQTLELTIVNGVNTSLDERVRVTQGDRVILLCTSDKPVQIHLHGYDIEKSIAPGTTVRIEFDAHATGRFPMTLHGQQPARAESEDHDHGQEHQHETDQPEQNHDEKPLFYLEVYPG